MSFALAPTLDTSAAGPLRLLLMQSIGRGEDLVLDAGEVQSLGQACLQVVVAARSAAAQAGLGFRVERASPVFVEMATLAGLDALVVA